MYMLFTLKGPVYSPYVMQFLFVPSVYLANIISAAPERKKIL